MSNEPPKRPSDGTATQRADQPLWPGVPVGSSLGMYPAIEITLHLDDVREAQRWSPPALEAASPDLQRGANLLPSTQIVKSSSPRALTRTAGRPGDPSAQLLGDVGDLLVGNRADAGWRPRGWWPGPADRVADQYRDHLGRRPGRWPGPPGRPDPGAEPRPPEARVVVHQVAVGVRAATFERCVWGTWVSNHGCASAVPEVIPAMEQLCTTRSCR